MYYLLSFLLVACLHLHATKNKQEQMLCELETIANFFDVTYGPAEYKTSLYQWDPSFELERARNRITSRPAISTKEFHQILLEFCQSTHDYHVTINFCSTENASLPFTIREAQNRYFIMDDEEKQAEYELISFDGQPTDLVVESLRKRFFNCSNKKTDKALATSILMDRHSESGIPVPQGDIILEVMEDGEIGEIELTWDYEPEQISFSVIPPSRKGRKWSKFDYLTPYYKSNIFASEDSYVPNLGSIEWQATPDTKNPFNGTIFRLETGELIGYIRISDFMGHKSDMEAFLQTISHLEQQTQVLVIDETSNPGGNIFFGIALISSLIKEPIDNIQESIVLNQREALDALQDTQVLSSEEGMQYMKHIGPYNFTQEDLEDFKKYSQNILSEWREGKKFTTIRPLFGLEKLRPHPTVTYTKPIIVLVDELCFSTADLLPAILQDNNQATIFGQTTAGAGGSVQSFEYPNHFGVDSLTMTRSVLYRKNGEALENNGVTPDYFYEVTPDDLMNGYEGYRDALIDVIQILLDVEEEG